MIGNPRRKFSREVVICVAVISLAMAVSGCGGDDEEQASTPVTTPTETATTPTEPSVTVTLPEDEPRLDTETATAPAPSPEEEPGGAGDEEPARTLALLSGANGRVTPRVVRVPAFIAIRVELRSEDGGEYALRFGNETIRAGGAINSAATTIDGLRPGEAIVGRPVGAGNRVRIEATAEPGP
jgi:hypothetical protein